MFNHLEAFFEKMQSNTKCIKEKVCRLDKYNKIALFHRVEESNNFLFGECVKINKVNNNLSRRLESSFNFFVRVYYVTCRLLIESHLVSIELREP